MTSDQSGAAGRPHGHAHAHHGHDHHPVQDAADGTVTDPVCGMQVDPAAAKHSIEHDGHRWHFCSGRCADRFAAEPSRYVEDGGRIVPPTPVAAAAGAMYTCPMHPEIVQEGPGSCPKCGMALEPMTVTAEEGPNEELVDMTRRFWVSLAFAAPVFVIAMARHLVPGGLDFVSPAWLDWAEFVLATPVALWCALPFFQRGIASFRSLNLNMFSLISVGVAAAYLYSVVALLAPGLFPPAMLDAHGRLGLYFEAAAGHRRPWSCWARCWNCARGTAPARRCGRCWTWRRRLQGGSATARRTRTCRWTGWQPATACGCAPARACRSTAR